MSLDLSQIGRRQPPVRHTWEPRDALLYALGVGAGQEDPEAELAFTTENTENVEQQVLPTFATLFAARVPAELLTGLPAGAYVHAEEELTLHRPLPVAGEAVREARVEAILDKGSGALVVTVSEILDAHDRRPLATVRRGTFLRGQGGFCGDRGPRSDWAAPRRAPDITCSYPVPPGQALVYRLSGDCDPLHSDPAVARRAGYAAPLMHGLCVFGYAGRALLASVCDGDPAAFGTMRGRFANPLTVGRETLNVAMWQEADGSVRFQTSDSGGRVVLGRGVFVHAS